MSQNKLFVFGFLVIIIPTCCALPKPQVQKNGHMLPVEIDEARETKKQEVNYETKRDADLHESVNGGQSGGWTLYFSGNSEDTISSSRPKRHETGFEHEHPEVLVNAEEPSNLPESYAGRFDGSAIAIANQLAGASSQAVSRGDASYGRKKRQAAFAIAQQFVAEEPIAEESRDGKALEEPAKEPANLPESYAGRFDGSAIAIANKLAGASSQAVARGEASYGRKRRQAPEESSFFGNLVPTPEESRDAKSIGDDGEVNIEIKIEETIPASMADQMKEIHEIQNFWANFLRHGISSRRLKRQSEESRDGKTLEEAIKEEEIMEEIFQVTDQINAIHGGSVIGPIEVKIKTWGETGNVVPAAVSKGEK